MLLVRKEIKEVIFRKEFKITEAIVEKYQKRVDDNFPNSGFEVTAKKLADIFKQININSEIENIIYDWLDDEMWAVDITDTDVLEDSEVVIDDWVEE